MNDSDTSTLLEAARRYARNGLYVFPVRLWVRTGADGAQGLQAKKGVRPIADWDTASTRDQAQIDGWWGAGGSWEGAAIGIDCGRSGIVGVDQDVFEGKNGVVEWEKLNPPATWRARSPTGGTHDYYRADPEHPVSIDNTGVVADGVDIRGQGGFMFAPPSVDPRGGRWQWVAGEPEWNALPMVPASVTGAMAAAAARKRRKAPGVAAAVRAFTAVDKAVDEEWTGGLGGLAGLFAGATPAAAAGMPAGEFGPDGGWKTRADALALLSREHRAFTALTTEGSARSHILSQKLGVLAGHGVGVFWEYEWALEALLDACRENGFTEVHGEAYAADQAARGLAYGMREPWHEKPGQGGAEVGVEAVLAGVAAMDPVEALLAEMLSLDQLESAPPPRFMIHKFLQFDSESWIIGAPGSKKSFVAFDMAARVVRGEPWQGFRTNPADIVFIVAEGASGHGKRVKAWRKRYGAVERDGEQHVFTLARPVQARDVGAWAVLVAACRRLADRAQANGRGLMVILDTQARVTVGLSENDNGEMNLYVEAVSAIRRATKACVLTIHHTKKGGGDARGASVIDGAQTTELKVLSDSGKLTGRLLTEKQKDVDEHPPLDLAFEVIEVGQDEDGEVVTSLVVAEKESAAFRAAWSGAEVTAEGISAEVAAREDPYKHRTHVDPWMIQRAPTSTLQHWIVQALVDTTETLGLTESGVKEIVAQKRGRIDPSTWRKAWQKVTAESGQWTDVIVRAGGERWAVDRVVLGGILSSD